MDFKEFRKKYKLESSPDDNAVAKALDNLVMEQDNPDSPYNVMNNAPGFGGTIKSVSSPAQQMIRKLAEEIAQSNNLKLAHDVKNIDVNPEYAKKVAQAFEELKHNPNDPDTKKAYDSLIKETIDQYNKLKSTGLKITPIEPKMENPYKKGSVDLIKDIYENNHLYYYPTEQGFGTTTNITDHPLLKSTGEKIKGKDAVANDLFRIIHDYFGHAKEGVSFGPKGEERAFQQHLQMFSPEAQKALATETRGQNSWVNFGPKGEFNRSNPLETIYADQKAGILPDWARETDPEKQKQIIELLKGKK